MFRIPVYTIIKEGNLTYPSIRVLYTVEVCDNTVSNAGNVVDLVNDVFSLSTCAEEYLILVAVNPDGKVLGVSEVSHGGIDYSPVDMKSVMLRIVLTGATSVIIVHNHPSGSLSPSSNDLEFNTKLKCVCEMHDIELLDNIVFTRDDYKSFLHDS